MATDMEQFEDRTRKIKVSTVGGLVCQQAVELAEIDALYEQRKANLEGSSAQGGLYNQQESILDTLLRQITQLKVQEEEVSELYYNE